MRWALEEIASERANEVLLQAARGFVEDVGGNLKALVKAGLDEGMFGKLKAQL